MSEPTSKQKQRRILVVANETCGTAALCAEIGRRAADDDAQVLMISPALTRTRLEYWLERDLVSKARERGAGADYPSSGGSRLRSLLRSR